jgi:hypothetical protein
MVSETESESELVLVLHLEWALEFHLGWESEKESGMILPFATPGTFHQSDTTRHTLYRDKPLSLDIHRRHRKWNRRSHLPTVEIGYHP